jgi:hypothetical protein
MSTALRVWPGIPPGWDRWVADDRVGTSRRSMQLAIDRFGDGYHTFAWCDGDQPLVAVGGTLLDGPLPNRRADPYAILTGRSVGAGLAVDGPHPWSGFDTDDLFPGLMIMHPHYDTRPVGPRAGDPATLDSFVDALLSWAAKNDCRAVSFLYQTAAAAPMLASLSASAGARIVPLSAACVLDVSWTGVDGYLGGFSYKRRTAIRRELRWLADHDVSIAEEDLGAAGGELIDLRCALVAKYGTVPVRAKEERLLRRVRDTFQPAEVCLVTARAAGRLLNFMLFVRENDEWSALLTGTDYDSADARFTYFATGFYHPAALAPAAGIRRIHYGFGSWEAKKLRGCRTEPVWAAGIRLIDRPSPSAIPGIEASHA